MHLIERIESLCKKHGISVRQMEADAGIGQSSVSKWKTGAYSPALVSVQKIAEYFSVSLDYLVGYSKDAFSAEMIESLKQQQYALSGVKKHTSVLCPVFDMHPHIFSEENEAIFSGNDDVFSNYEEVAEEFFLSGKIMVFRMKDDSMSPLIHKDDVVLVRKQEYADSGDIVLLNYGNSFLEIRRMILQGNGMILQPLNPDLHPEYHTNAQAKKIHLSVMGKVIESRHKFYGNAVPEY